MSVYLIYYYIVILGIHSNCRLATILDSFWNTDRISMEYIPYLYVINRFQRIYEIYPLYYIYSIHITTQIPTIHSINVQPNSLYKKTRTQTYLLFFFTLKDSTVTQTKKVAWGDYKTHLNWRTVRHLVTSHSHIQQPKSPTQIRHSD